MKNNLSLQLSSGANMMISEQGLFHCNDMANEIPEYGNKFFPAKASVSFGPLSPVTKIYGKETGLNPSFNISVKLVAARLSEIELALDCYDVYNLRISTHELKNLFLGMRMPAVCQLAVQMEELAKENQLQGVKDLLRGIKKIIGWIVKHRKQPRD